MSKILRKTLFTLLTLGMALLLIEGVARLAEAGWPSDPVRPLPAPGAAECMPECMPGTATLPERPAGLPSGIPMVPHGSRAWALPPNTVMVETNVRTRVNSLALRGAEVPAERAAGEVRLMTLGDSSVFGFGVEEEDVFGAVAAEALAARWSVPVTPINGGTPGYTSEQALQTLADVGEWVRPDWVVIACLWSDLFQTDVPIERAGGQRAPLALYRIATRLLAPWLPAPTVGWIEGSSGEPSPGRTARVGVERYARNLDALVAHTTALGARPVFLVLPAPSDLDPLPTPAFIEAYRLAMGDAARRADAPLVDGPARFRSGGATNEDFFDQVHPSTSGHSRLGAAVAQAIHAADGR